ncbi:accessory Sec system translocase SecA2 [Enterococcus cecorum]|uniref:accessory Sec system translocase SecA2 n=1 Tax=Enterococcus cecorum TaxID=44008 RepID=UPI0025A42758|nr:accessory Sec system translocase SecA2 [Enterococcus cecorum]MDM8182629.1 accessory Sec system translocase SecA2 [Enterococcus cecorum]
MDISLINLARLNKSKRILKKVNQYQEVMRQMTDEELQHQTIKFKKQLNKGATLDQILPEAYATVREVAFRLLGMFPYDVQVLGAIVMHSGNIAEMKTGEGKTLTATMPMYLNALTGEGAMLVTSNSYLAGRDAEEMGPVYRFLGLSVAVRNNEESNEEDEEITVEEKRDIYNADILYTTNDALGFDYLFNNLADRREIQFMRPFNFALIDEIDEILLDKSQIPLIISGAPHVQSNLYGMAKELVSQFEETKEFKLDKERKSVWLLPRGYREIQRYMQTKALFTDDYFELLKHVTLALQARMLHKKDKDYVVIDDKVLLLDERSGRILTGNKLQLGIHQAIEAKEEVEISDLTKSMASITYQNLFRMFKKLAGMTGTGRVAETEFIDTYNMYVVPIPTNKPSIRKDFPDKIYATFPEKLIASVDFIQQLYQKKQPVLIGTGSVKESEIYSKALLHAGVPHNLLNAKSAVKEAKMIAEAGQLGAVTVATAMVGRGTDIKLGPGVKELGGLAVIGTERMSSLRIDLQLRGRAGRQGDPGFSQFFVSLEDSLMLKNAPDWVQKYVKKHDYDGSVRELTQRKYRKLFHDAQELSDSQSAMNRTQTLQFDDILKQQREKVYAMRDWLMQPEVAAENLILPLFERVFTKMQKNQVFTQKEEFAYYLLDHFSHDMPLIQQMMQEKNTDNIHQQLQKLVEDTMKEKKEQLKLQPYYQYYIKLCFLKAIDTCWIDQVDRLDQVKRIIQSKSSKVIEPIQEYQREAKQSFLDFLDRFDQLALSYLMLGMISQEAKTGEIQIHFP